MCVKLKRKEAERLLGSAWEQLSEAARVLAEAGDEGLSVELRSHRESVYRIGRAVQKKGAGCPKTIPAPNKAQAA